MSCWHNKYFTAQKKIVFLLRSSHNRIQQTVAMKEVFIYFPTVLHHTSLGSNTMGCSKLSAQTKKFHVFFFVTLHQISLSPSRAGWGKISTKKSLCCYAALLKPQFQQIQQTDSTKKKLRHKNFIVLLKGPWRQMQVWFIRLPRNNTDTTFNTNFTRITYITRNMENRHMRPITYFSALNLTYYGTMVQLTKSNAN